TEATWTDGWEQSPADFVVLGLPEDTGVRANLGLGGAATAWSAFLKSFLNMQETGKLSGSRFILLGNLETDGNEAKTTDELRTLTKEINKVVFPIIARIVAA